MDTEQRNDVILEIVLRRCHKSFDTQVDVRDRVKVSDLQNFYIWLDSKTVNNLLVKVGISTLLALGTEIVGSMSSPVVQSLKHTSRSS